MITGSTDVNDEMRSQFDLETFILETLRGRRLFAIEVTPQENRDPGRPAPKSEALARCLCGGWLETGAPASRDPRVWLSAAGGAELERRRRRASPKSTDPH